jgi:cephalosporin hydroxylase
MNGTERRVRLSTYVLFVDYGSEVEIQHTLRGTTWRIDRRSYEELMGFRRFRDSTKRHARWIEAGVLVAPYRDEPRYHGGLRPGTEAQLGHDYQEWYWRHEIESERVYRWLGRSVLKMPSDLFFYQELIVAQRLRSVLEIGYGSGGGLWFFATILSMVGGGEIVGVDRDGSEALPDFGGLRDVRTRIVNGDAHEVTTVERVRLLRSDGFDLIVIDADPQPAGKMRLLARWAEVVAPGGYVIVEDVSSPACSEAGSTVSHELDEFLLQNRDFSVVVEAARFPFIKSRGAVFRREG